MEKFQQYHSKQFVLLALLRFLVADVFQHNFCNTTPTTLSRIVGRMVPRQVENARGRNSEAQTAAKWQSGEEINVSVQH